MIIIIYNQFGQIGYTTMLQQEFFPHPASLQQLQQIPTHLLYLLLNTQVESLKKSPHINTYLQNIYSEYGVSMDDAKVDRLQHCHPNIIIVWVFGNIIKDKQKMMRIVQQYFCENQDPHLSALLLRILQNYEQYSSGINLIEYKAILGKYWHQFVLMYLQVLIGSYRQSLRDPQAQLGSFLKYWKQYMHEQWIEEFLFLPISPKFTVLKLVLSVLCTVQPELVPIVSREYTHRYIQFIEHEDSKLPQSHIFLHLKFLQVLHIADPALRLSSLSKSEAFMRNLYECLSNFDTKGANVLSINIYGSILRELEAFDTQVQAFIDLYLTLDCFGMHLVKDTWDRFYVLCRGAKTDQPVSKNSGEKEYKLFPVVKLLHLILSKVEQHSNHNVPKYCIQELLAANPLDTCIIFQQLEETVYSSLVQILNTGTHYSDCTHFHQDSKIYRLTSQFHLGYYNQLIREQNISKFQYHIKKLLTSMLTHITFEHCIIAYASIFADLDIVKHAGHQVKVLGAHQLTIMVALLNRFLVRLTFRKRWKFITAILSCIEHHVDIKGVGLNVMVKEVIMKLPDLFLEVRHQGHNIPSLLLLIGKNLSQEIPSRMQQVSEEIKIAYQGVIVEQYLEDEVYKRKVNRYYELQRELVILQVIYGCQTANHEPVGGLLKSIEQLSRSLYSHPIEHASAIYSLATYCKYSDIRHIANFIQSNAASTEALLGVIGGLANVGASELLNFDDVLLCVRAAAMGIQVSSSDPLCRSNAKFIEYCISRRKQSEGSQYYLFLLLNSLKYKLEYCHTYRAIEDSLYQLYENLEMELVDVAPKYRLRAQILLFCILSNDFEYAWNALSSKKWHYVSELRDYCNLYDYDYYQEFFAFCGVISKLLEKAHDKGRLQESKWDEFKDAICSHLEEAIKSMLHNLDYGIHKKEVVSSTERVVQVAMMLDLNQRGLKIIDYILEVGEKYWGFQRHTTFLILEQILKKPKIDGIKSGFAQLIGKLVCIEEYRGEDSAIILESYQKLDVYKKKLMHPDSDYDGTSIRFVVIEWSQRQLDQLTSKTQQNSQTWVDLWMTIFQRSLKACLADNSRERMFMTGSHKNKIKYWQFLMVFPDFLHRFCTQEQYNDIVVGCMDSLAQNNLIQIRHYIQTFMLKLIYLSPDQQLLPKICRKIKVQLLQIEGQNSLLKNVSFMMVAGLILELCFQHDLFSILFSSVCSHIAYYRGLSQYFCYRMIEEVKKLKSRDARYMVILHNEFLKDQDAIKLRNKLHKMVTGYKELVRGWNIYDHLLKLKPSLNGQVVSEDHYIDKLKCLGQQLIKENRHEDGFMSHRQAWKRIIQQSTHPMEAAKQQNLNSFQRKIDPSLDDLYSFEPIRQEKSRNQLKTIVVSAHQIAFYGHMARVGQILGISQLCIPDKKILEMQQFSNVSVTAEKWLNISEHKFQRTRRVAGKKATKKKQGKLDKKEQKQKQKVEQEQFLESGRSNLLQIVKRHKDLGYKVYLVKKGTDFSEDPQRLGLEKKTLLIVDELGLVNELEKMAHCCVSFNYYYSYHVEATILMWQYFKKFSIEDAK